jgi:hypothetical protein
LRFEADRWLISSVVIVYAIADRELHGREGLGQTVCDVHLTRSAAEAQLGVLLEDEPAWADRLLVVQLDLRQRPPIVSP